VSADFTMRSDEHTHIVAAWAPGEPWPVGHLSFGAAADKSVTNVHVDERYRHRGIATGMLRHAVAQGHAVEGSPYMTPDGAGWARHAEQDLEAGQ
jgi:ribosomal protein S18 acetylase RimI-like enzyme